MPVPELILQMESRLFARTATDIAAVFDRQAVENGGYTVAVLANGLDSIYPSENRELAQSILEGGGALVSEQPPGSRAFAQNLIQRDRLQSGMSLATFVFQTDVVGGTMHTVRFTLTQGRLLFAPVPPSKYAIEEKSRGIRAIVEKNGLELADILKAERSIPRIANYEIYEPSASNRGQRSDRLPHHN